MKHSIKVQRELDKVAKILAAAGISTDTLEEVKTSVPEQVELEADAVLLYYDTVGKHFTEKTCPECNRIYATTNPRIVGRCSNKCRAASLAAVGVIWDPYKSDKERWGNQIPLNISPEALDAVKTALPQA